MREIDAIYQVFKDYYGEDRTDLKLNNDTYEIYIHWPSVTITNEFDESTDINNLYAKEQLLDSITDIKKGVDVSRALDKSKVLPPMLIEMISIIKNDENLLETLKINYQFYDKEFEKKMNRIIVLIEPIMIILISIIIIGIMISVFIPMFSLMDNIGGM
jgi:type IV pilus assembly protein PilC